MNLKMTSPFLTAKGGLSSSQANFLADVIKNICAVTESQLSYHVIIEKKIDTDKVFAGVSVQVDYVHLTPVITVEEIISLAQKEGEYYGLSAWLREGIKAKESILEDVRNAPAHTFVDMPMWATYSEGLVDANRINIPSEGDLHLVYDRLTVAERAEFLAVEAQAAWIGKRIHSQNGLFNQWRKQALNFKPVEFLTPNPTKSLMITNTLRLQVEDIDRVLLALQGAHRALEQKVNSYKSRLKTMVAELIQEGQAQRTEAENAMRVALLLFQTDQRNATAKAEVERSKMIAEASKLGIVKPKMHEATLKEVMDSIDYTPDEAFSQDAETV